MTASMAHLSTSRVLALTEWEGARQAPITDERMTVTVELTEARAARSQRRAGGELRGGLGQRRRLRTTPDFSLMAELGGDGPPAPHLPSATNTLRTCSRPQGRTNDAAAPTLPRLTHTHGCPRSPAHSTVSLTWLAVGPNQIEPAQLRPSTR